MACYLCAKEGVKTDGHGPCKHCSQDTCGEPPSRRDGKFHGEECKFRECGVFLCERHMHRHPHSGAGVSQVFPAAGLVIGSDAVAAVTAVGDAGQRSSIALAARPELRGALERYLNCISPGTTALLQTIDKFPHRSVYVVRDDSPWAEDIITFTPAFFTLQIREIVGQMAARSVAISRAVLEDRGGDRATREWLDVALKRVSRVQWRADRGGLPEEQDRVKLAHLLADASDEDNASASMTAGA